MGIHTTRTRNSCKFKHRMGSVSSRHMVKGLLLPAQRAKTQRANTQSANAQRAKIRKIKNLIEKFSLIGGATLINNLLVPTDANNKLLVSQTEDRFRNDLGRDFDEEEERLK